MFGMHQDQNLNRRQAVTNPLMGGLAGAMLQNIIARRIAGKVVGRVGGLPGMVLGIAATYAIERYLNRRPVTQR